MEAGENFKDNDDEFKKLNNADNLENIEVDNSGDQNEIIEEEESEENENFNLYNVEQFELDKILNIFFNKEIFAKYKFCPKCGNLMKLDNNKNYLDGKVWRCRTKIIPHDIKINIRDKSLFEDCNIQLQIIYFLTFYCFPEKLSIEKSYLEIKNNQNLFGFKLCTKNSISKVYNLIRKKIKDSMHLDWSNHLLGDNLSVNGYPIFEIDESKIIGNNEKIYWMFGIIDRITKESRVFCVLNNRSSDNLMNLIKGNIATNHNIDMDLDDENIECPRIYSDCFASYQPNNFRDNGYILKRVNHSVWFGYGTFHTNNIEGLWSQIKRLSNNYSGITIEYLEKSCQTDDEKKEILDNWICYSLFMREIERKKLSKKEKISLLCKYIKI